MTGPGKLIFLAGVGAEDEHDGTIRHEGDFLGQCRYAFDKIERLLARHGATLSDIVKMVTYVTDVR
ncbi:MAG TPA: RidA family protein, partial [Pseudolabrys sp.]|nr:RidA family protein [Pseudolabrys sp.]